MTQVAGDDAQRALKARRGIRSRLIRDFAADWQRWSPAERLTAGVLFAALWLSVSSFYLSQLFPG
jgi:hypothetical protein